MQGDLYLAAQGLLPDFPNLPVLQRTEALPTGSAGLVDFAELRAAAFHIRADIPHDAWASVLSALHHATGGSDAGRHLAHAWSAADPRCSAPEVDGKWRSFGKSDTTPVTAGSLFALAREHGWQAITAADFVDDTDGDAAPADAAPRPTFLCPGDCLAFPARPYIVKGLIGPGQLGGTFGDPGTDKSLLAPRLAYAIALGGEAFGLRTRQGGPVLCRCRRRNRHGGPRRGAAPGTGGRP